MDNRFIQSFTKLLFCKRKPYALNRFSSIQIVVRLELKLTLHRSRIHEIFGSFVLIHVLYSAILFVV